MDGTPYQPAPAGVWRSSPERILLWALTGALHRIEREIPEAKHVRRWQTRLRKEILKPVDAYPWRELWTAKHIRRDDGDEPQPPEKVVDAWAKLPELIGGADGLWMQAAKERADALELPFDPEAMEKGFASTMHLVSSIPDTLHDRLRDTMRDAYRDETGPQAFARRIRDDFAAVGKDRADLIAQTEWNRAASTATLEGYKAQGIDSKVWYTIGDDRVCSVCETNAAEAAIPISQEFYSGDQAPPAHPGCRCDISAA